ncbi:MAG: TusE/DsrC/DsvC family sulfur relay protein [Myxococcales bacterium]|nr:TusE/DsrC/DsvC family sulfur relay protein [Myxococcales bacterium]
MTSSLETTAPPAETNVTSPTTAELMAAVSRLSDDVATLVKAQAAKDDLLREMTPVAKEVMAVLTNRLDEAERAGWFEFGRALLGVAERVAGHYSPEDVRQLGDNIVAILDTVKRLTQPDMLTVLRDVTDAVNGDTTPVGIYGMMKATRDDDVKRGFGVLVALLKQLGRSTAGLAPSPKRSLATMLAPRRTPPALPAAALAPRAAAPRDPVATVLRSSPPTGADACGISSPKGVRDESWTHDWALAEATRQGLVLTDAHWALIDWARHEQGENGVSPNIRRLSTATDVPIKEIYALFPKAPAKSIAILAGIPKPAGCI